MKRKTEQGLQVRPPQDTPGHYLLFINKDPTRAHTYPQQSPPIIVDKTAQFTHTPENNSSCMLAANSYTLDPLLEKAFFDEVIVGRICEGYAGGRKFNEYRYNWTSTKRWITEANVPYALWQYNHETFYDAAQRLQISTWLLKKMILLLNKFIQFSTQKHQTPLYKMPVPRGRSLTAIQKTFNASDKSTEVDPLTSELLKRYQHSMLKEHYRFFYICLWVGLRPSELARAVVDPSAYSVQAVDDVPTLHVYQAKLVNLDENRRWKQIPLFFREQQRAVRYLEAGAAKAPSQHFLKKYFGQQKTLGLYSGRKGFAPLMMSKGLYPDEVFRMLGHQNVQMMARHYTDQQSLQTAYTRKTIERFRKM